MIEFNAQLKVYFYFPFSYEPETERLILCNEYNNSAYYFFVDIQTIRQKDGRIA